MRNSHIFAVVLVAVILTTVATAATAEGPKLNLPGCNVTDYGHGVYYLKCYEVGPALSKLRELYPQASLTISSSSYGVGSFNVGTTGYYVIVNPSPTK